MKSIFEFIDYRLFLASFYEEQKKVSRFFSYRYFAHKAGINSPSFFKHIVDGKRNLTRPVIEKFCNALKLTPKEATYFRNLVLFNQAKTASEKQEHYAILRSLTGNVKESLLHSDQFDYFALWYMPVIRELICLHDFKGNYKALATTVVPNISVPEAKKAVDFLLRLNLIEQQPDGKYIQKNSAITVDGKATSDAIRLFTKKMIDHSKDALDNVDKSQRNISGVTMGISMETYEVLAAEIEAFKDRVKLIVNQDENGTCVYQMNIALFPVSKDILSDDVPQGSNV